MVQEEKGFAIIDCRKQLLLEDSTMLGAFSPSEAKGNLLPDVVPVGKEVLKQIEKKLKDKKAKIEAVYFYINRLSSSVVFVVSENGKKVDYVETAVPKPDTYLFLDRETSQAIYKVEKVNEYVDFAKEVEGDFAVLNELLESDVFGLKQIKQFAIRHFLAFSDWDVRYFPVEFWNDVTRAILLEKNGERLKGNENQEAEMLKFAGEPEDLVVAVLSKESKYLVAEEKNIPFKILSYSFPHKEIKLEAAGEFSLSKKIEELILSQAKTNIFPKVGVDSFEAIDLKESKLVKISGADRRPLSDWAKALKKNKDATIARILEYLWKNGDTNVPFAVDFIKVDDITTLEASKLYSLLEFLSILDIYSDLFGVIRDRSWQALGERYVRAEGILNDAAVELHKQFRALRTLVAEKIVESYGYTSPSTIRLLADALVASQRRRLSKTARQKLSSEVLAIAEAKSIDEQVNRANKVARIVIDTLKPLFDVLATFTGETPELEEVDTTVSFDGLKRKLTVLLAEKDEQVDFVAPFYYRKKLGFSKEYLDKILNGIKEFKGVELDKVKEYFALTKKVLDAFNSAFGAGSVLTLVAPESVASIILLAEDRPYSPLYTLVSGAKLTAKEAKKKKVEDLDAIYRRFVTSLLVSAESGSLFGDRESFYRAGAYLFNLANAYYGRKLKRMVSKVTQPISEKIPAPKELKEEEVTPLDLEAKTDAQEIEQGIKESEEAIKQESGIPEQDQELDYIVQEFCDEEAAKLLPVYEAQFDESVGSLERILDYYNRIGNKINRLPVILDNFLLFAKANEILKEVVKEKLGDDVLSVPANKAPEIWDAVIAKAGVVDSRLRSFFEFMLVGGFTLIFRELAAFDDSFMKLFKAAGNVAGAAQELDFFLRDLFVVSSPFVKASVVNGILNLGEYLRNIGYPISRKLEVEPFSNEWLATVHEFAVKQDRTFWGIRPLIREYIRSELSKLDVCGKREALVLEFEGEKVELKENVALDIEQKIPETVVTSTCKQAYKLAKILSNILFVLTYLTATDSKSDKVLQVRGKFSSPEFQKKLMKSIAFIALYSYLTKRDTNWKAFGFGYIKDNKFVPYLIFGRKKTLAEKALLDLLKGEAFDKFYANAIRSISEGLPVSKVAEEFFGEIGLFGIVDKLNTIIDKLAGLEGDTAVFHLSQEGDEQSFVAIPIKDILEKLNNVDTSKLNELVTKSLDAAGSKIVVLFSLLRYAREYVRKKKVDLSTFVTGKGKGKHEKNILNFLQEVTLYSLFETVSNYGRYYYRLNAYFGLNSPTAEIKLAELFSRLITSPSRKEKRTLKNLDVHELDLTVPFYNEVIATQSEMAKIEFSKLGIRTSIRVVPNTAIYEYLLSVADIEKFKLMSTPEVGFPNIIPYFATYLNSVISEISQQEGLKLKDKAKLLQTYNALLIRAHYAALKVPVPKTVPTLMRVKTREIYPRGVETLFTNYETLVTENIGRMLELSEYVQQAKLYHTVRAGVFLMAILSDVVKDVQNQSSVAKELLDEINRLQKGLRISGSEDVAYYANALRSVVYQSVTGEHGKEVEPIFATADDAVFAVTNLNKLYKGEEKDFWLALKILFPLVYTYADLLTIVANIRKKSLKDIKDALSLINWYRDNILVPIRTMNEYIIKKHTSLDLDQPLLKEIGANLTISSIDNNLKQLVGKLMSLSKATHEALKGNTATLEAEYTSFRSLIKNLVVETGILSKTDFAKAYYALKVFSNLLAFEEYIYDSIVRTVPESEVAQSKTAKALLGYKQKVADFLILNVHSRIIRVGLASTFAMPNAVAPINVLDNEKAIANFSKIAGRIKERIEEIASSKPNLRELGLSAANTVVIAKLSQNGYGDYASAIGFLKRRLSKFFEDVAVKEIGEIIVTALKEIVLEAINELYKRDVQELIARKAKDTGNYYASAISVFHATFTKLFNKKITKVVRDSAISLALTNLYKDMLEYLNNQAQTAFYIRTALDAVEFIRSKAISFLEFKKAELDETVGATVSDTYAMAVTNIMVERLGYKKDTEKTLALKKLIPFLFLTPAKYVEFLKRHNIPFQQKENSIETTYAVVADAIATLKKGENALSASLFLNAYLVAVFELYAATRDVENLLRMGVYSLDLNAIIIAMLVNLVPASRLLGEYFYYVAASLFAKQDKEILEFIAQEVEEEVETARKAEKQAELKEEELRKFFEEALYSGFDGAFYLGSWGIE